MNSRIAAALLLVTPAFAGESTLPGDDLVVHEWGTFTSVAGEEGRAVRWAPLLGPADLPCFVDRLAPQSPKYLSGFVRMETPVLYFYSTRRTALSVRVEFPQGWITEWYPHATRVTPDSPWIREPGYRNGRIEWDSVEVLPGANPGFPSTKGASRYYAARQTDAAPLRAGQQFEKLIFYRGIGDFLVPLRPTFTSDGKLKISNAGAEPLPLAILFENRQGKLGYRIARGIQAAVELDPPDLAANLENLLQELAGDLVEFGLYRKEALAMIETWRDSWFEEGTRVFYIIPRAQVDSLLPLHVAPAPSATARVFVGRVEVLSPWLRDTIETALARGDVPALMKFGRFLEPFVAQIRHTRGQPVQSPYLQQAASKLLQQQFEEPGCVE